MMKDLKDLLKKKAEKGEFMDDKKMSTASKLIGDLEDMADEGMAKGMQKVTVAADDSEGLEEGLETAQDIVEEMPEMEEMSEESEELEDLEDEEMDIEEIDEMIKMLMEKKRSYQDMPDDSEE